MGDTSYQLVVNMGGYTRRNAWYCMDTVSSHIAMWIRADKIDHTIDWWYCTPSNAGRGTLGIAFRPLGIYEMAYV
jgi:hypothetical protein